MARLWNIRNHTSLYLLSFYSSVFHRANSDPYTNQNKWQTLRRKRNFFSKLIADIKTDSEELIDFFTNSRICPKKSFKFNRIQFFEAKSPYKILWKKIQDFLTWISRKFAWIIQLNTVSKECNVQLGIVWKISKEASVP